LKNSAPSKSFGCRYFFSSLAKTGELINTG
jgi:hypothetical protein